jgi:hypothetical protein
MIDEGKLIPPVDFTRERQPHGKADGWTLLRASVSVAMDEHLDGYLCGVTISGSSWLLQAILW